MIDDRALVLALEDLGRAHRSTADATPEVDLAPLVVARIRARTLANARRRTPALLVAAIVIVVVTLATLVSRPAREAVADLLGIGDTRIEQVKHLDVPPERNVPLGARSTFDGATNWARFTPRLPEALGPPSGAYIPAADGLRRVTFAWPADRAHPRLPSVDAGVLLTEAHSSPGIDNPFVYVKRVSLETPMQEAHVNGADAVWVGGLHVRFGPGEAPRAAANTLLWLRDGVVYRLETRLPLDETLRIAASIP
jgi:hypothetical protein